MTRVPDDHLKANYGQALVSLRLSSLCLVRPVAGGTDVGVDLHCESVAAGGKPFLHFWIQVKTGSQCRVGADGTVGCEFDRRHLEYWLQQPVPVFAALVPTEWPIHGEPGIHVIDLTKHLLENGVPQTATKTIDADQVWAPGDHDAVRRFANETVPETHARLRCREGVIGSIPTPIPGPLIGVPTVPVRRYQNEITRQIRKTAAFAILYLGRWDAPDVAFARRMAAVLAAYADDEHWENYAARGLVHEMADETTEAAREYASGIACIENDKSASDPGLQQSVALLRERLAAVS